MGRPNRTDLDISMPHNYNPGAEQTEEANVIRGLDSHSPLCEYFEGYDGDGTHSNPRFLDNQEPTATEEPPIITYGSA